MRKMLIAVVVAVGAFVGIVALSPEPAECSWCLSTTCIDSVSCGSGCACAGGIGDPTGYCVEVSQLPELLDRGYRVLGE